MHLSITVPGNPPRKDDHWTIGRDQKTGRRTMMLTKNGRVWRDKGIVCTRQALVEQGIRPSRDLKARYAVLVVMYVPQWSAEHDCPRRDLDSALSPTLDMLEAAGVFVKDMQVAHIHPPQRHHDPKNPRTQIEVTTWGGI